LLLGEYEHTIDDKNRLTLPARFREAFAGGVVVTRGIDPCLAVYTREGWDDFVRSQLISTSSAGRRVRCGASSSPPAPRRSSTGRGG